MGKGKSKSSKAKIRYTATEKMLRQMPVTIGLTLLLLLGIGLMPFGIESASSQIATPCGTDNITFDSDYASTFQKISSLSPTKVESTINVSLSELSFSTTTEKNISYDLVEIPGYIFMTNVGEPMLPMKNIQILIPPDARFDNLTIASYRKEELPGTYNIYPAQPPKPVSNPYEFIFNISEIPFVEPNQTVYSSDQPYPGVLVEYINDGYLAGYHIVTLSVYPLQYVPSTKKLTLYKDIKFDVNYKPSISQAVKVERRSKTSQYLYDAMVKSLIENPLDIEIFSPDITIVDTSVNRPFEPTEFPSTCGSIVEYVIITNGSFQDEFQEFADWKTKKGVPTVIRNVSWIEENYPDCDTQEKIRNFVKDAYSKWGTQWVLLGGDTDVVPDRKAKWSWVGSCNIPTDLYYSDLDGDWNGDRDAYFGESSDNVDLIPDLFVGRAPVDTNPEAASFVSKIFEYEKSPDLTYITKALLMAVVGWSGQSCKDYIAANYISGHFHIWKLYESGGDEPLNRDNALNRMNEGYHFINHIDHSGVDFMGTNVDNIWREDMDSLTNDGKFSILWTFGCSPNAFDHDSISEHFILNPSGGGVAFIGNTRASYGQCPQDKQFFCSIFDDPFFGYSLHHIGMAFASTQGPGFGNVYSYLMNLLGDPEMPVWTNTPGSLNVDIEPSIESVGPHPFIITVRDLSTGTPLKNAIVCLYKEGEVYAYGKTDDSGTVSFTVKPDTLGTIGVTVTAQNYLPYEGEICISIVAINVPYLYYKDHSVDDSACVFPDGVVDAGETVKLPVTLRNGGTGTASNVKATLSLCTPDPFITIIDDYEEYGDIPAGGTATCIPGYVVEVSPDCPDEHEVRFCLTIIDDDGNVWEDEFTICVMAPNLWHSRNGVYDENGNGVIEPGETVELSINVTNGRSLHNKGWRLVGHGVAPDVTAILTTLDPYVTITQASVNIGDILPGEEKMSLQKFTFEVSSSWPGPPDDLDFGLIITDSYGRSWSHLFELTPPEAPTGLRAIPGKTSIKLAWNPNIETDLAGYNIYLLGSGTKDFWGYYIEPPKLNTLPVTSACYEHTNLASGTGYDYRVVAIDSSGNEGEYSIVRGWTNPKDQLGWHITVDSAVRSSPAIADLDGNPANGLEVVVASLHGHVYAWHKDGSLLWEHNIGADIMSSPAVGDIDADGKLEVVIGVWTEAPNDNVYALNGEDGTPVTGSWPKAVPGWVISTPALADIDPTTPGLEVVVTTTAGKVYVWDGTGTSVLGWGGGVVLYSGWLWSSPAIGDIDGDGFMEIVVAGGDAKVYALNHDGTPLQTQWPSWNWPSSIGEPASCGASLGDIDNDGDIEIVVQTNIKVYVLDHEGNHVSPWPRQGGSSVADCSPALGDIDGDGTLEIVVGADWLSIKEVHAWHHGGTPVSSWPQGTACGTPGNPVIGDIDGDEGIEIIVGCLAWNENVYAWHSDGTGVNGFPIKTGFSVYSVPALGDIDGDDDMEVVVGSYDYNVYAWDCDCAHKIEWGTFRHDVRRTGFYPPVITVDDEGDGDYTSIQAAINAATPGWTIKVYSGTYSENVRVWQNVILEGIPQELGSGTDTGPPVVDGSGSDVFYIESNDVVITGFITQNGFNGIRVDYGSDNVKIHDNEIVSNNGAGILIADGCDNNIISNNYIIDNGGSGISVSSSWLPQPATHNKIIGNTIEENVDGISFFALGGMAISGFVTDNEIIDNTISNNDGCGISLVSSGWGDVDSNTIIGNTISNNNYGISLKNRYCDMVIASVNNNEIKDNIISDNNYGILLQQEISPGCTVDGNRIFNNYFDNGKNAEDNGNNVWNIAITPGINIIGGPNLGGNYWHDYTGLDDGTGGRVAGDGIGDTSLPYNCGGNIVNGGDWNPLVWPCACEEALYRGNVSNPEEKINSIRELRDEFLRDKYVNLYYEYNPEVRTVLIEEPYLLIGAANLLVKYIPAVNYVTGGDGEDLKIEEKDVKEANSFIENLKKEIWERREEIGINRSSNIIEFLEKFEKQVNASEGKTFSQAFRDSIYARWPVNETEYQNSITQPVNVSEIRYKFKAVDEEWAAKWTTLLLYGQKETKYSIEIYLNDTGYVTRVDFGRWGFPITEIPYELAEQSLAKLPPGFALDP